MKSIYLKKGKEKPVLQHHPWIFSGAVSKIDTALTPGDIVKVCDADGNFLSYAYANPHSQIFLRNLEWQEKVLVNDDWWQKRIQEAVRNREEFFAQRSVTSAFRLIYSEADFLPGLIVDYYNNYLVVQSLTAGIEKVKLLIVRVLTDIIKPEGIFERSDADVRKLEGLQPLCQTLAGKNFPESILIHENGLQFRIDSAQGQKTGFYLDQKNNRKLIAAYTDRKEILDCFSYTGGFAVYALKNNAHSVIRIDSSGDALLQGDKNINLNELDLKKSPGIEADVFQTLRKFRDQGKQFDLIILDPPKFAPTNKNIEKAGRAYKDINLLAMKLIRPQGMLATFSCSGGIDRLFFQRILSWAAQDAGKEIQILHTLSQSSDHPVRISFPESEYLKGYICRVL